MKINMKSKSVTLATKGCYCPEDVEIEAKMQEKTIAQNGEVVADSGFAGLSKVIVAVPEPDAKIVDVDKLPTENIGTEVYYRIGGKLYKYKYKLETAVGTWVFNKSVTALNNEVHWEVTGTASCDVYTLDVRSIQNAFLSDGVNYYVSLSYSSGIFFRYYVGWEHHDNTGWHNLSDSPTLVITGGSDADNPDLIAWLEVNATRQGASAAGWECYLVPDGELEITQPGTYDVSKYATVVVNITAATQEV